MLRYETLVVYAQEEFVASFAKAIARLRRSLDFPLKSPQDFFE